jgi:hypothetical protein
MRAPACRVSAISFSLVGKFGETFPGRPSILRLFHGRLTLDAVLVCVLRFALTAQFRSAISELGLKSSMGGDAGS